VNEKHWHKLNSSKKRKPFESAIFELESRNRICDRHDKQKMELTNFEPLFRDEELFDDLG
jgi:hypothetical protein